MATIDIQVKCELNRPVVVRHLDGMVFSQDAMANRIVVSVVRGGVPEELQGSVSANIVRADGTTVVQTGSISGNVATVTLPAAAYAVSGPVAVFVKNVDLNATATIAAITGYVYTSSTDAIVDPGTIIPNVSQLLAATANCMEAVQAATEATAAINEMTASASTLPADEEATVTATTDPETGGIVLQFGIPRGAAGNTSIDDTAGSGFTDKTWSANKLSTLAPKASPAFTGSVSLGRSLNSTVGANSSVFGNGLTASGNYSHAEGRNSVAIAEASHAEGYGSSASGQYSHAESHSTAHGMYSHAEGDSCVADGRTSHAEGEHTQTGEKARGSHAEGYYSSTVGEYSHAEGYYTVAAGSYSSVSGIYNAIDEIDYDEWPEWTNTRAYAVGDKVRVTTQEQQSGMVVVTVNWYICKTANVDQEFTLSHWTDQKGKMNFAEIVGNGSSANSRSNARSLDWNGNERLKGDLYVGCNDDSSGGKKVATEVAVETVSGTTPTITGVNNTRYICGEVSTISITPPSSGIFDVIFTSGSTPAILTIPSTVKLPEWFDADSLEANKTYEINILDGIYGAVSSWT